MMSTDPDIFSVMTVHALDVATETAERVAREHWGIAGTARVLTGERDRNFHFRAEDGREFVLKFANPVERAEVVDMQIQALRHVAGVDPSFPVPRVIPMPDGSVETLVPHETGGIQRVRLLSWVPGTLLHAARRSAAQRAACGRGLARLEVALAGFTHPATGHALIWDMQHLLRLRELAPMLGTQEARDVFGSILDEFAARVAPALPNLRRQVLYNDMNGGNTLVDSTDHDRLAGIIDFGDMVETAVAIDVGTGATSQLATDINEVTALGLFVGGYHAVYRLLPEEIALIPLLTAARIAMSLTLQSWHRKVQPDNPHYADVTEAMLRRRLDNIAALRAPGVEAALRRACAV
ncbi:MAG: phosphotransferase [Alphaproteobacteria bacterium]|nr:phosphotransferase [Alphaproteobacteria bacterium]